MATSVISYSAMPCTVNGSSATCTVGPGSQTLRFKVQGVSVTADANVGVPHDVVDPDLRNNTDQLLLGLL